MRFVLLTSCGMFRTDLLVTVTLFSTLLSRLFPTLEEKDALRFRIQHVNHLFWSLVYRLSNRFEKQSNHFSVSIVSVSASFFFSPYNKMDQLQRIYASPQAFPVRANLPPLQPDTYENHALNPAIQHRHAGWFPYIVPEERVKFELQEYPKIMFQHNPKFAYFPEHSNLDVNLDW